MKMNSLDLFFTPVSPFISFPLKQIPILSSTSVLFNLLVLFMIYLSIIHFLLKIYHPFLDLLRSFMYPMRTGSGRDSFWFDL